MALRSVLILVALVAGEDVAPRQPDVREKTYQGANQAAKEALQRIVDLKSSVEKEASHSLDEKGREAEERAESDLGVSRKQLSEHFVSLSKDAASEVAKFDLEEAASSLKAMEEVDKQLRDLSARAQQNLEVASRAAEDFGRDTARSAERQVDLLTREARKKTDHLSRVSRRYDLPDVSQRIDAAAEEAARKVQDAAERGARAVEASARGMPRQFSRNEEQAELRRERSIAITRELIRSAQKKGTAAPTMLDVLDSKEVFFVSVALAAGAASAVLAVFFMGRSEEVEDKYLLVV